jgi:hypothetical protein
MVVNQLQKDDLAPGAAAERRQPAAETDVAVGLAQAFRSTSLPVAILATRFSMVTEPSCCSDAGD